MWFVLSNSTTMKLCESDTKRRCGAMRWKGTFTKARSRSTLNEFNELILVMSATHTVSLWYHRRFNYIRMRRKGEWHNFNFKRTQNERPHNSNGVLEIVWHPKLLKRKEFTLRSPKWQSAVQVVGFQRAIIPHDFAAIFDLCKQSVCQLFKRPREHTAVQAISICIHISHSSRAQKAETSLSVIVARNSQLNRCLLIH